MPTPRFLTSAQKVPASRGSSATIERPDGQVTTEIVHGVAPDGRYLIRGEPTPTRTPLSLKVGDAVSVLWRGRKPFVILNMARRHGPGTDEVFGGPIFEHLFVAVNPKTGLLDVWFRNKDVVTPLNLPPFLGTSPSGGPRLPVLVKWGYRDDTFAVQARGVNDSPQSAVFYVFKLNRSRRQPLSGKPKAKLLATYNPKVCQAAISIGTVLIHVTAAYPCVPGWVGFCCATPEDPYDLELSHGAYTLASLLAAPPVGTTASQSFGCLSGSEADPSGPPFKVTFSSTAVAGFFGDFVLDANMHLVIPVFFAAGATVAYTEIDPPPTPPYVISSDGASGGAVVDLTAQQTLLTKAGASLDLLEADTRAGMVVTLGFGPDSNNRVFKNAAAVFVEDAGEHFLDNTSRTRHRGYWVSIPDYPATKVMTWDGYDAEKRTFDLAGFAGPTGTGLPVPPDLRWANPDFLYDQALLPPARKSQFAEFLDEGGAATLFDPQREDAALRPHAALKAIPEGTDVDPEIFFNNPPSSIFTRGEYHAASDASQLGARTVRVTAAGKTAVEG